MIQLSKLTALLVYEFTLIVVVLFGVLVFYLSKGKAQTTSATNALWKKRKESVENCRDKVYRSLEEQFNYTGAQLETASKKMIDRENQFFNNVQNRALDGDNGKLISGIHSDFYYVLDGYRELTPEYKEVPSQLAQGNPDPSHRTEQEYNDLVNKNRQLAGQLNGIMTTMDDILEEYAAVFESNVSTESLIRSKDHMLDLMGNQIRALEANPPSGDVEPETHYDEIQAEELLPADQNTSSERPLGNVVLVGNADETRVSENSMNFASELDISNDTFLDTSLDEFELASL